MLNVSQWPSFTSTTDTKLFISCYFCLMWIKAAVDVYKLGNNQFLADNHHEHALISDALYVILFWIQACKHQLLCSPQLRFQRVESHKIGKLFRITRLFGINSTNLLFPLLSIKYWIDSLSRINQNISETYYTVEVSIANQWLVYLFML